MNPTNTPYVLAIGILTITLLAACKKDKKEPPASSGSNPPPAQTVTDMDGNLYQTVVIGGKRWMKENLRTTRYRNGDPIATGLSDADLLTTSSGAYTIYENIPENNAVYGKLYNHYAVTDPRGLCPTGWHAPTDAEWVNLETALGMDATEAAASGFDRGEAANVGGKLRNTTGWLPPNVDATNSSGYSARPGGLRSVVSSPPFGNEGSAAHFWTTTPVSLLTAFDRSLFTFHKGVMRMTRDKHAMLSCRCIQD